MLARLTSSSVSPSSVSADSPPAAMSARNRACSRSSSTLFRITKPALEGSPSRCSSPLRISLSAARSTPSCASRSKYSTSPTNRSHARMSVLGASAPTPALARSAASLSSAGTNFLCSSAWTAGPSRRTSVTTLRSSALESESGTSTSISMSTGSVVSCTANIIRPSTVSTFSVCAPRSRIVAVSNSTCRSNTGSGGSRGRTAAWQ